MYKTILVPLDHSSADEAILSHVRQLVMLTGARLVLVHVADGYAARYQKSLNLADSPEIIEDRAYLDKRRAELAAAGMTVTAHLGIGDPAQEILKIAGSEGADLIAMSTHGHGFVMDVLLGSVSHQLRHRTDVPILLVRAPKA